MRFLLLCFILQLFSSCSVIFSNRRDTYQEIQNIKDHYVLILLKSVNKKVEHLIENGDLALAKEIKEANKLENQNIVEAINAQYDFSEFYFIKGVDNKSLFKGDFDQVKVYDKDMNLISGDFLSDKNFYYLSFDGVYGNPQVDIDENGKRSQHAGGEWYPGISMLDSDGVQLKKPFPQLGLPTYKFSKKEYQSMVNSYNKELNTWYKFHRSRINKFTR